MWCYETATIARDIDGAEQEFEVRIGLGFDTGGMIVIESSTVDGADFDLTDEEHRDLTSEYRRMQRHGGFND
jgi:hypothetical protein